MEEKMEEKKGGFIKIHRSMYEHWLWKEKRKFSKYEAWEDLLQLVSYSNDNSNLIENVLCKWNRGQFPISISFLKKRWGWTDKVIRNYLKLLTKEGMIKLDRASKWSMLTICKYEYYNEVGAITGQSQGSAEDNQRATIKENKENKENKEVIYIYPSFNDFWNLYDKKMGKETSLKKWSNLKQDEKELIMLHIPDYKNSVSELKYLKNPITYLNGKCWNDEIIINKNNKDEKRNAINELANQAIEWQNSRNKTPIIEISSCNE